MSSLVKNEFYKLKREWFVLFLLLLSLLPVLTGGAGALFNRSTKTVSELFFFMNNQFAMFFPMVIFILIGSLFYQEYKNKTYITWITYGYAKANLFWAKLIVCFAVSLLFAAALFLSFGLLLLLLQGAGSLTLRMPQFGALAAGFFVESLIDVLVTSCAGAIVIILSRSIVVTSVVGVIYGFASCFFIGAERGFVIPGGFAYRVAMYFSDASTYYDQPLRATVGGVLSTALLSAILFCAGLGLFARKKKIEG